VPLEEYQKKRNFSRSPEPQGNTRAHARRGPLFFCVQKHLASHLHYDFRIEHDGVLLSWAVPKGPSLDPTVKRLAMHVEDHPIEYGDFEGVIPEGYGAGIVMLWDRGTWEPQVEDVNAALRKGDLKFRLDGVKLKGSWALVRTRSAGERSWLLLKHRDEWAGPVDIAEFAPLSVKGGGDFADILAQENPAIWVSNRPAKGGDAGAMFARIIERALAIRQGTTDRGSDTRDAKIDPNATKSTTPSTKAANTQRKASKTSATRATPSSTTTQAATRKAATRTRRSESGPAPARTSARRSPKSARRP
jgi:DNA ligase D-like protein (predicted 3'-phosphoesterase)